MGGRPTVAKGRSASVGCGTLGDDDGLLWGEEADGGLVELAFTTLGDASAALTGMSSGSSTTGEDVLTGTFSSTHSFVGRGIKLV
jgi:hypothetical protein